MTLVAGAFGARALEARRAPVCPSAEPTLAGVWDDARRGQMAAAFRASKVPYAEDAVRGVSRALDDYAAQWVAMHGDACAATRVRGEQSSELLDLRMECLGQRLGEVRALVDQLVVADAHGVEGALRAADGLVPLSRCADATALRAPIRLPTDPAARARIEEIRAQLAKARALDAAARFDDAARVANDAVAAAKAVGHPAIEAEALEAQGVLFDSAGDETRAAASLEDAVLAAVAGRDESTESQAWIDLVLVAARDGRQADGDDLARHAHAALDRSPDDTRLAALLTSEGIMADDEEKLDVARAKLEQALALEEKRLPADHPAIAETLNQLANTRYHEGRNDEALELYKRVLAIRERAFGPSHPLVARTLRGIGNALSAKGDYDAAIANYRRSLDVFVAAYGEENRNVADTLSSYGLTLAYARKFEEAIEVERHAVAIEERVLPPGHTDIADALINEAEAYSWAGRWAEVIAADRRAIAIIEKAKGPKSPRLTNSLTQMGDVLNRTGHYDEARAPLERALAIAEASASEPIVLATTRGSLAVTLKKLGQELPRARKLAALALETYLREPLSNEEAIKEMYQVFPQTADGGQAPP
jgi:tetratricopeptide (TPR) repeat protein